MESKICKALKLAYQPVAILWSNERPAGALQFKGVGSGCVMSMFAQAAAKGKTAAFDKTTFGCFGGGAGLGFGRQYENFPVGGIECFRYFLSTGLENSGKEGLVERIKGMGRNEFTKHLLHGEGYRKTPELVEKFLEDLPSMEVPTRYVIFKPLKDLADGEVPVVVIFTADTDQLSALVILVNYDRAGNENVIAPAGAGCHQIGVYAFKEAESKNPKAVIGLTDIQARRTVRGVMGKDIVTLAVPYNLFIDMESNVEGSFLERDVWKGMAGE